MVTCHLLSWATAMHSALRPIHALVSSLCSREGAETCCDENVGALRNHEKLCTKHWLQRLWCLVIRSQMFLKPLFTSCVQDLGLVILAPIPWPCCVLARFVSFAVLENVVIIEKCARTKTHGKLWCFPVTCLTAVDICLCSFIALDPFLFLSIRLVVLFLVVQEVDGMIGEKLVNNFGKIIARTVHSVLLFHVVVRVICGKFLV